jgi:membrane protein DedA with SNARE-associated domain
MSEKILGAIAQFIIAVISASGYWGVALLMGIESACIPLPSEVIMPFAGYLVHMGKIGAYGGRPLVEKFGRYVLLSQHDLDRVTHYFEKFGGITVFFGRLLPVVRTFIALPAGIAKMPQGRFHLYTFLGSWPWCYALAYVGMRLGDHWDNDPRFKAVFHRFHLGVELVLVVVFVWFVWSHWRNRTRASETA